MTSGLRIPARLAGVVAMVAMLLGLVAGAAAADPPGPTSWESTVTDQPADDGTPGPPEGVTVSVVGGDSFLQVRNAGHEILVPGYDGLEDYLHFEPDGTVLANLRSKTHWLNQDRYGGTNVPAATGADVPPQWVQVADDGTYAWHDHRVHWMAPTTLPGDVDPSRHHPQHALDWAVPLEVDGVPVVVTGTLTWLPPVSPWVTIVAGIVVVAAGVLVARRSRPMAMAVVLGASVAVAGLIGLAQVLGLPDGVPGEPLPLVLAVVAAGVGGAGLAVRDRTFGLVVAGLAGIPLVVWAISQSGAATAAMVPPESLPAAMSRIGVGLGGGGGVALVAMGLWDLFHRPVVADVAEDAASSHPQDPRAPRS